MSSLKTKLIKNSTAYTLTELLPYMVSFIMMPIYTRYMEPSDYGILALVNAFKSTLLPFVGLQLKSAVPRFFFEYEKEEFKKFFSSVFFSSGLIAFSILFCFHIVGDKLVRIIYPKANIPYFPYFFIIFISTFIAELGAVINNLLVVQERAVAILFVSIFSSITGIGLGLFFVVYMKMKALGALLASLINGMLVFFINIFLIKEFLILSFKKKYFLEAFHYSWPIIPHALGGFLFRYSDRIVMEKFLPLSAIGLYNIADKFSMFLKLIVNSTQ